MNKYHKLPRLFLKQSLGTGGIVEVSNNQNHYISNVLRMKIGNFLRVFNEQDGEFLSEIQSISKKTSSLLIKEQTRISEKRNGPTIAFSLIKKQRQDFLIEKCTELGIKTFQPIITDHSEVRNLNQEKLTLQIIEATEQCERLTIPFVENLEKLDDFINKSMGPIYYGLERSKAAAITEALKETTANDTFLIGPEGGFSTREKELLSQSSKTIAVNLGPNILRAETAAIACTTAWLFKNMA
tara:strand:- start:21927 stop:22649 length:723 start_codon:yes stop_codon:yes gene_type:complete